MAARVEILGVPVDKLTLAEAVARCQGLIAAGEPALVVTPNAEILYHAQRDPELLAVLRGARLVVPDGAGVVLAARLLGDRLPERVPGVDLVAGLLAAGCYRVFLVGGQPAAVAAAAAHLPRLFPGTQVAGWHHGYFDDDGPVLAAIRAAAPQVLLGGMGSPRQEKWLARQQGHLGVPLLVGIGGGIDLWAGRVERAPLFYRRANLEWLWRIVKLRRFARAGALPRFVLAVLASRLRRAGGRA